jgi:hypothetical protein
MKSGDIGERNKQQKVFEENNEKSFISTCQITTNQKLEKPPDDHERKIIMILRLNIH